MVPRSGKLSVAVQAIPLEPQPFSRLFVAALFRRAHDIAHDQGQMKAAKEESYNRGYKDGKKHAEQYGDSAYLRRQLETANRDLDQLKRVVEEFYQASGIRISQWNSGKVGAAVDALMRTGPEYFRKEYDGLLSRAEYLCKSLRNCAAEFASVDVKPSTAQEKQSA